MKKIQNFKIKNCEDCFYWQSEERLESKEFCYIHQQDYNQPLEIFKQIKNERKNLRKWRIIFGTIALILGFCFFYLLFELPGYYHAWKIGEKTDYLNVIVSMFQCMIYLPFIGWVIYQNEKDTKQAIKELSRKKQEWIIEYE